MTTTAGLLPRLFQDPSRQQQLVQVISMEIQNVIIRQNVTECLDLLLGALEHVGRFCTADERKRFIADYLGLIKMIWDITVCQPSQYRFLDDLRKKRLKLIGARANAENLKEPDWLVRNNSDPVTQVQRSNGSDATIVDGKQLAM